MPSGAGALLVDVAERGDVGLLMSAVRDSLRAWVGVGPVFLATADPMTGEFTGTSTFDIPDEAAAAFLAIEMAGRDVVSFQELSRSPTPLGSLFAATGARPESSERWRAVINPLGWGDELRAAVRLDGRTWGYLCVHRDAAERPFSRRELSQLAGLLPAIAAAIRRAALLPSEDSTVPGTGVVVVDQLGRIAATTGGAEAWLDEFENRPKGGLPLLLAGVAGRVFENGLPTTTTIDTPSGRVGTVEAAMLHSAGKPQVAVVISSASVQHRLDRLTAAGRLTAREREVVDQVLSGMSTQAIADRLSISPYTVQAHLTSVFSKTALRSRRELISRLTR